MVGHLRLECVDEEGALGTGRRELRGPRREFWAPGRGNGEAPGVIIAGNEDYGGAGIRAKLKPERCWVRSAAWRWH